MELEFLLDAINSIFPAETAMSGDKIGLQIHTESNIVNGLLITLEVIDEVIEECIKLNFNTILTFHPLIYSNLSNISIAERVGKLCSLLIKNSINLISLHTAFDAFQFGTSKIISDNLGLISHGFLVPDKNNSSCGMGVIASPKETMNSAELIEKVHKICCSPVRYSDYSDNNDSNKNRIINKIAIVGGSGTSFIPNVLANNCDAFITADVTYHQFHTVKDKLLLIDVGHYEMEQFVPRGIANALQNLLNSNKIRFETSKILTNPIRYFPNGNDYLAKQNEILKF